MIRNGTANNRKINKVVDYIVAAFKFVLAYCFKSSPLRAFSVYAATVAGALLGTSWIVKGHINDDGISVEWSISSAEYTWIVVAVVFFVTIAYVVSIVAANKKDFDDYRKTSSKSELFAEVYLPFFQILFQKLDIKNFSAWAYNLAVCGDTSIRCGRYDSLRELQEYCSSIQHREGFEEYFKLVYNLRDALSDMLDVFTLHMEKVGNDSYQFHKFYSDLHFNPNYNKDLREYDEEVLLIGDLMFELTRILNLLLQRIRVAIPGFMSESGILTIPDATDRNHNKNVPIEYTLVEQTESESPYPGLRRFLTERGDRQHFYSKSDYLLPILGSSFMRYKGSKL